MDEKTRRKLVEAFEYIESSDTRRAFREILGMALQLGREIKFAGHGAVAYSFRLGGRPSCAVRRQWLAIYTTSQGPPLRVRTVEEVLPGIFGSVAKQRLCQ